MPATHLVCQGCGAKPPTAEPYPFRCPAARWSETGDDIDHVLQRTIEPSKAGFAETAETNPFLRYRERFHSYGLAQAGGLSDGIFVDLVKRLDRSIADVEGHGVAVTPFVRSAALGDRLGLGAAGGVWVKDDTGQVAGSHKARHLLGILIHLDVMEQLSRGLPRSTPLCIASCGNAALAAAILCRAAKRPLDVFIPPWAHPSVVALLGQAGARLTICPRDEHTTGDPCYHRFRQAVDAGAIPLCCQGPDNGLTIEGGETLGYEIVSSLLLGGGTLDRVFVQVGGGALASACVQAFTEAVAAGVLQKMPRIHAVQTRGAAPLSRAHQRVQALIAEHHGTVAQALQIAAGKRSAFMWPWEQEPQSIAEGILDDETYDWLQIVGGMLRSGGGPLVVDEETLIEANRMGREATGIDVSHTGTAGLAGLLQLRREGKIGADEHVAVLFTGIRR